MAPVAEALRLALWLPSQVSGCDVIVNVVLQSMHIRDTLPSLQIAHRIPFPAEAIAVQLLVVTSRQMFEYS